MPSLPRLRIGPLADIAARAAALPADPARAMLQRAESLADRVDPERLYPLAGVLADLRADRPAPSTPEDDDSSVVGAALLADLPSLVEHLSAAARLDPREYTPPAWLDAAAVCKRWGVSRSTLDRYRKRGLVGRRIEPRAGRPKLVFASARVEIFEARHRPGLERAGSFTRISAGESERMLRRAARYQRVLGWSPSRAAARIAERFGRSHEAVRQLLLRRGPTPGVPASFSPGVPPAPPVHAREREIIARAARFGVSVERLAQRFDRSEGSIYRSLVLAHAERLVALGLDPAPWEDASERFTAPDAPRVFLDHASVQTNLGRPAPSTLAALVALVDADEPLTPGTERALARAHAFLRHRAALLIAALPRHNPPRVAPEGLDAALTPGGPPGVDEIETVLRWASRLKAELVRSQLPLAVRTIEGAIERPLASLTPAQAAGAYELAVGTLSEALERHDPFRAGRIAAQAGLALNRTVAAWWRSTHAPAGARPGAARVRATPPELVPLPDFTVSLSPWQRELDLPPRLRSVLSTADDASRTLVAHRMGWQVPLPDGTTIGGGPPRSLAQIANETRKPAWRIARLEGQSVRALLAAARGPTGQARA